jgi:hypothetical protein
MFQRPPSCAWTDLGAKALTSQPHLTTSSSATCHDVICSYLWAVQASPEPLNSNMLSAFDELTQVGLGSENTIMRMDGSGGKYYVTNDPNCRNVIYSSSYSVSFSYIYLCGQCKGGNCPQVDGGEGLLSLWRVLVVVLEECCSQFQPPC